MDTMHVFRLIGAATGTAHTAGWEGGAGRDSTDHRKEAATALDALIRETGDIVALVDHMTADPRLHAANNEITGLRLLVDEIGDIASTARLTDDDKIADIVLAIRAYRGLAVPK